MFTFSQRACVFVNCSATDWTQNSPETLRPDALISSHLCTFMKQIHKAPGYKHFQLFTSNPVFPLTSYTIVQFCILPEHTSETYMQSHYISDHCIHLAFSTSSINMDITVSSIKVTLYLLSAKHWTSARKPCSDSSTKSDHWAASHATSKQINNHLHKTSANKKICLHQHCQTIETHLTHGHYTVWS